MGANTYGDPHRVGSADENETRAPPPSPSALTDFLLTTSWRPPRSAYAALWLEGCITSLSAPTPPHAPLCGLTSGCREQGRGGCSHSGTENGTGSGIGWGDPIPMNHPYELTRELYRTCSWPGVARKLRVVAVSANTAIDTVCNTCAISHKEIVGVCPTVIAVLRDDKSNDLSVVPQTDQNSAESSSIRLTTMRADEAYPYPNPNPQATMRVDEAYPYPNPNPQATMRTDEAYPNPNPQATMRTDEAYPNPNPNPNPQATMRTDEAYPYPYPNPNPQATMRTDEAYPYPNPQATMRTDEANPYPNPNPNPQATMRTDEAYPYPYPNPNPQATMRTDEANPYPNPNPNPQATMRTDEAYPYPYPNPNPQATMRTDEANPYPNPNPNPQATMRTDEANSYPYPNPNPNPQATMSADEAEQKAEQEVEQEVEDVLDEAELVPFYWSAGLLLHPDFAADTRRYMTLKSRCVHTRPQHVCPVSSPSSSSSSSTDSSANSSRVRSLGRWALVWPWSPPQEQRQEQSLRQQLNSDGVYAPASSATTTTYSSSSLERRRHLWPLAYLSPAVLPAHRSLGRPALSRPGLHGGASEPLQAVQRGSLSILLPRLQPTYCGLPAAALGCQHRRSGSLVPVWSATHYCPAPSLGPH